MTAATVAGSAPLAVAPARRSGRRASPLLLVTAVVVGLAFAAPLGYLGVRNLRLGGDLFGTLTSATTLHPLRRSVVLATAVSAACAALGTALAWILTRTDVPGRRGWRLLVALPLVIPSFVGAASLVAAFAPGGLVAEVTGWSRLPTVRGFTGAFVVLTLLSYPYVYLPVAARLASLPPSPEESARLLGRSPVGVFRSVVLPQITGAIWAGTLLVFLYVLSDFGAVAIVRYDTLTRAIYSSRLEPATWVPLSLVLALLALGVTAAERAIGRRRMTTDAPRARRALHVRLGRWKPAALTLVAGTVGLSLLAPVTVLGWWAGRGLAHGERASRALVTDPGELLGPIWNTASIGLVTAAVAVLVVLPVALLTVRHGGRAGGVTNAMVVAGFALPGLVTALALVFWVLELPAWLGLYQTLQVLVLAYVLHFGAQAMRAAQVAVGGVPARVEDAARMLGAGRARRFVTIELPLMLPGLLAGAGMVLLSTMKELPATLLLAPTGFQTLATRIWAANEDRFLAETGLTSLVLVVLSGALTWLLVLRRSDTLS
jgi:iron(III) transport system permease protein